MANARRYDRPAIIFCATQRTGSTMVVDDFQIMTGTSRSESEGFWKKVLEPADGPKTWDEALARVEEHRKDEVVFFDKVMFHYLHQLSRMIDAGKHTPMCHPFYEFFADATWVHIRRADIFGQAVSKVTADKLNVWHKEHARRENFNDDMEFNAEQAKRAAMHLIREDNQWLQFFRKHGIKPVEIFYEDAVEGFPTYLSPIIRARGLEVDLAKPAERRMQRLGNERSDRLARILRDVCIRDLMLNNNELVDLFRNRMI